MVMRRTMRDDDDRRPHDGFPRSLIAAKEYYAGVGGSVLALQKEISLWPDTLALDTEAVSSTNCFWQWVR